MTWHVARRGQTWGPIRFDDLKRAAMDGRLRPDDHLWEPGMVNWQPASQVSGLWGPPHLPDEAEAPPAVSNPAQAEHAEVPALPTSIFRDGQGPPPTPEREADAGSAGHKKTRPNLIAAHWRGELSLGLASWAIGVLLTLAIWLLLEVVAKSFPVEALGPIAIGLYLVGAIPLLFCLPIWQSVGIWRSANNHTNRGGRSLWSTLAKLAVALGVLQIAIESYTLLAPILRDGVKLAVGIEDDVKVTESVMDARDSGFLAIMIAEQKEPLAEALPALPEPVAEALAALPNAAPPPDEKKLLEEKLEQDRRAEEERKQVLEEKLEQERKAEEERKQALEEKLEQDRKAEEERIQAEKKRKEVAGKKKQHDGQRAASLLNGVPDKSAPPAGTATPSVPSKAKGAMAGALDAGDSQLILRSVAGVMMNRAVGRCWTANSGLEGANRTVVEVEVRLRPDGRLVEPPRVLNRRLGPILADAANRAVDAIVRCEPYDLPMGLYQGGWDHMVVTFDPQLMFQ
jgi:hypothetical protein